MFTGIITAHGRLGARETIAGDVRLWVDTPEGWLDGVRLGDSIAVSGVCLTVVARDRNRFAADVSRETLGLTTLGALGDNGLVNLEQALRLSGRLGGHMVSGHVDGLGEILEIAEDARSQRWTLRAPPALMRFIATKGSITVNGVSLTVNTVEADRFGINLIPHTVENTDFRDRRVGDAVNLEADVVARYVERLLDPNRI